MSEEVLYNGAAWVALTTAATALARWSSICQHTALECTFFLCFLVFSRVRFVVIYQI